MKSSTPSVNDSRELGIQSKRSSLDEGHHQGVEKLANATKDNSSSVSPCPTEPEDTHGKTVVSFEENDKSNPYNWSKPKKLYVVITGMAMVLNSTMGSALPSGATGIIQEYWDIQQQELLVLPVSIYLIGYILGPMVFAPLSESYGRKIVMICTFVLFTSMVLGCALAPNYAGLIVFRLLAGIGASTPVSVIGGIYADLYNTPRERGVAITAFMAMTTWGPLGGPLISGYASIALGWRWVYWIELIFVAVTWPFLLCMPETFGPVILQRKAKKLRKQKDDPNIIAPSDLETHDFWDLVTAVLTRPIRMFLFESIVLCSSAYLSLAYGIFYIYFQAYEPIFGGVYGFTPGQVGLAFLPMGVGSLIAGGIYLSWDAYLDRMKNLPQPPAWSKKEEYNRLPIACLGGPLFVISLFWLGWSARPDVHWSVPVMSALPFGIGFLLIFMALINYVVDAYEIFAASAMGATSASRSTVGVVLPFAAGPLFQNLGIAWACTLFGILSALMSLIPFIFIRYGERIRQNSEFCQDLKRKKAENEEKQQRIWATQRRHNQTLQDAEKQV